MLERGDLRDTRSLEEHTFVALTFSHYVLRPLLTTIVVNTSIYRFQSLALNQHANPFHNRTWKIPSVSMLECLQY
jgi:hypothetical protein